MSNDTHEIILKQQEILQNEKELDFYLSSIKIDEHLQEDKNLLKINRKQKAYFLNSISAYNDAIEECKSKIKKINEKVIPIDYQFQTFPCRLFNYWDVSWSYKYSKKKKSSCIKKISLTFISTNQGTNNEILKTVEDGNKGKHKIEGIGEYEILDSDFENGIFELKFYATTDFNGSVTINVYGDAKKLAEYQQEIQNYKKIIQQSEEECKNERKKLDDVEKKIGEEQQMIKVKEEMIKDQSSQKKIPIIECRLERLGLDLEKLVKFLYDRERFKFLNQENILRVLQILDESTSDSSSLSSNLKLKYEEKLEKLGVISDSNEKISNSLKNKIISLSDEQTDLLAKISTEIGLTVSSIETLLKNMRKLKYKKPQLHDELNKLLEERNADYKMYEKKRNIISKEQKALKIVFKIKDILDFKENSRACFVEASSLQESVEKEMKDFKIIELNEITLVDFIMPEDVISPIPQNLKANSESNSSDNFSPINSIIYNFLFDNLRQSNVISAREICVNKLKVTNDRVNK